jgi:putative RecB family exonuclease
MATLEIKEGGGLTPPPYLSPSSIGTWQQCPLKYKYSRIDGLVDPPTEATVLGNFVHETLEELLAKDAPERTKQVAKVIMRSLWESKWTSKAAEVLPDKDEAFHEFRWKAWWCVENYFTMEDPTAVNLDGIETQCEIDIDGVQMKGFIDRWEYKDDGTIRIGDYKTGKTPRKQYTDDKFQQLYIYAHLLGTMTGKPVTEVELLYLKDGVRFNREVTSDDLSAIAETVKTVRSEVEACCETGEFPAIKHRLCDWCSYKTFCPAWV